MTESLSSWCATTLIFLSFIKRSYIPGVAWHRDVADHKFHFLVPPDCSCCLCVNESEAGVVCGHRAVKVGSVLFFKVRFVRVWSCVEESDLLIDHSETQLKKLSDSASVVWVLSHHRCHSRTHTGVFEDTDELHDADLLVLEFHHIVSSAFVIMTVKEN